MLSGTNNPPSLVNPFKIASEAQNDDRIHQELELDAAVENHRHGDRGDEEPRTRREELPDEEHDARRILGRIAEAVAFFNS